MDRNKRDGKEVPKEKRTEYELSLIHICRRGAKSEGKLASAEAVHTGSLSCPFAKKL